jgi:hypothetical protein
MIHIVAFRYCCGLPFYDSTACPALRKTSDVYPHHWNCSMLDSLASQNIQIRQYCYVYTIFTVHHLWINRMGLDVNAAWYMQEFVFSSTLIFHLPWITGKWVGWALIMGSSVWAVSYFLINCIVWNVLKIRHFDEFGCPKRYGERGHVLKFYSITKVVHFLWRVNYSATNDHGIGQCS